MKKLLKNQWFYLSIILIISVGVRIHWMGLKKGVWENDELFSFKVGLSSTGNKHNYNENKLYTMKEILQIDHMLKGYHNNSFWGDIKILLKDTKDSPHPNLYYLLLRMTIFKGVNSLDEFKTRGVILNIILFIISLIFYYKLSLFLFNDDKSLALFSTFIYSVALFSTKLTMLIRMYQLSSLSLIILTYLVFNSMKMGVFDKKQINLKPSIKYRYYLYLILSVALVVLSHYFGIVFMGFLGLAIIFHYVKNKSPNLIIPYIVILISGFVLAILFYHPIFKNLLLAKSGRTSEALNKVNFNYLKENIIKTIQLDKNFLISSLFYERLLGFKLSVPVIVAFIYIFYKNKHKINHYLIYIISLSFITQFIILYIAPDTEKTSERYVIPSFAFIVFLIPLTISFLQNKKLKYLFILIISFMFFYYSVFKTPFFASYSSHLELINLKKGLNIIDFKPSKDTWMNTASHLEQIGFDNKRKLRILHSKDVLENGVWKIDIVGSLTKDKLDNEGYIDTRFLSKESIKYIKNLDFIEIVKQEGSSIEYRKK